jgi:dihydropyrimidine dehydrogenase (NAD+) subunit PreT
VRDAWREEKPIEIGRLQRFAMETFYAAGGKLPLRKSPGTQAARGVYRRGPGQPGLRGGAAAAGLQVTIFDKRPLPGGLNTYGVAEYKLRTADSLREVEMVRGLGVEFVTREIDA